MPACLTASGALVQRANLKPHNRKKTFSLNDSTNYDDDAAPRPRKEEKEKGRKQTVEGVSVRQSPKSEERGSVILFGKKSSAGSAKKGISIMNKKNRVAEKTKSSDAAPPESQSLAVLAFSSASLPASPLQQKLIKPAHSSASVRGPERRRAVTETKCTDGSSSGNFGGQTGGSVPFVGHESPTVAGMPETATKSARSNSYNPNPPAASLFRNSPLNIINKNFNMNRLNFINNRAFVPNKPPTPQMAKSPRIGVPVVKNLNYVTTTTASGEKRLTILKGDLIKDDDCKIAVQAQDLHQQQQGDPIKFSHEEAEEPEVQLSQQQQPTTETEEDASDDDDDDNTQHENERILFQPAAETVGSFPLSPSLTSSKNSSGTKILFEKLLIERLKSTSSSTVAAGGSSQAPNPSQMYPAWSMSSVGNRKPLKGPITSVSAVTATLAASTSTSSSAVTASAEYLVGSASSSSSINNDEEASSSRRQLVSIPVSTSQMTISSRARVSIPSSPSGNLSERPSKASHHMVSSSATQETRSGSQPTRFTTSIKPSITSTSISTNISSSSTNLNSMHTKSVEKIPTSSAELSRTRKYLCDENEYRMDHPRRGVALIINNKNFASSLGMPTRDGTDKDANHLEMTLSRLGFDIKIVSNRTAASMKELMLQLARCDHSDADCFLCVIMSHGEDGFVYGIDREINIDELVRPFQHNKTLVGKPKLFFIQACRGTSFMDPIGLVDSNPFDTNEQYVSKIPMQADFLIAYSTISGYYSWRNSANGSWFIQALCEILNKHGFEYDLLRLLTLVNRKVAYHYKSNTDDPGMNNKRQIPCILSMLTKDVYFKPKPRASRIIR